MSQQTEYVQVVNRTVIPADAPDRAQVIPWGRVESKRGEFIVDAESASAILSAFEAHGVLLVIDKEHQTVGGEFASPDGSAPAMGWITAMEAVEGDGIYARVDWTEEGAELVKSKKYRYFSPTLYIPKGTVKPVELHSVALTNKPAIVNMRPITNKATAQTWEAARYFLNLPATATEQEIMDELEKMLAQLRDLTGVAEGADQEGVFSALQEKLAGAETNAAIAATACKALELGDSAKPEDIEVAICALKDPTKHVPADKHSETLDKLTNAEKRIAALELVGLEARIGETITVALREGRMCQAQKESVEAALVANYDKGKAMLDAVPNKTFPAEGRETSADAGKSAPPSAGGDPIMANAEQFDVGSMERYKKIKAFQQANKVSYGEAMAAIPE